MLCQGRPELLLSIFLEEAEMTDGRNTQLVRVDVRMEHVAVDVVLQQCCDRALWCKIMVVAEAPAQQGDMELGKALRGIGHMVEEVAGRSSPFHPFKDHFGWQVLHYAYSFAREIAEYPGENGDHYQPFESDAPSMGLVPIAVVAMLRSDQYQRIQLVLCFAKAEELPANAMPQANDFPGGVGGMDMLDHRSKVIFCPGCGGSYAMPQASSARCTYSAVVEG